MPYDESDADYDRYMEDWYEYAQDAAQEEFYNELAQHAINAFATARLQAFYRAHPLVIQAPLAALHEARTLACNHPSAAVVFAIAATEVCFKAALLKPIVSGLVHAEASAEFLVELAIAPKEERLVDIMQKILAKHGGVDLQSFKRPGADQALWQEIKTLRKRAMRSSTAVRLLPIMRPRRL